MNPSVRTITVPVDGGTLEGDLTRARRRARDCALRHGSGSSRHSPRNQLVARHLEEGRLATLLVDLLTEEEEAAERRTRQLRFDIGLLIDRLAAALDRLAADPATAGLPVGCFGASTGAAAALGLAGARPKAIAAVVSRGGRLDLTPQELLACVRRRRCWSWAAKTKRSSI